MPKKHGTARIHWEDREKRKVVKTVAIPVAPKTLPPKHEDVPQIASGGGRLLWKPRKTQPRKHRSKKDRLAAEVAEQRRKRKR